MCPSQADLHLFRTTLDLLLAYANARLGIVGEHLPATNPYDDEMRRGLVARALWKHVEIIDDYVRENPDRLARKQLDVARDLHDVIYDDFVYVGTRGDKVMLAHETGTYLASGTDVGPIERFGHEAPLLRLAIVPFMSHILVVGPVTPLGWADDPGRAGTRVAADEPPVDRGEGLARRARIWQEGERRRRRTIAEHHADDEPGPGYHRGALAGLDGTARVHARAARYDLAALRSDAHRQMLEMRSIEADAIPMSLAEGLDLLDGDWLMGIAQHVGDLDAAPELPRAELIDFICAQVTGNDDLRDTALMWCEDEQFELLRALSLQNPLLLDNIAPSRVARLYPMLPFVFILQEQGKFVAWMPPEVGARIARNDLDDVARVRAQLARAARAADALASMCGVIDLDQAWERYRAIEDDPLDREHFELTLVEMEVCDTRDSYALWEHDKTSYLVSGELSDQSALAHAVRRSYAERMRSAPDASDAPDAMPFQTLFVADEQDEDDIRRILEQERERLAILRLRLLREHAGTEAHPLERGMLETRYVDWLLGTPVLRRVRDYVDAHMPDCEDDYEFAETFCQALVVSALFQGEPYDETLDVIRLFGMQGCEGSHFPHDLGRMVTDVFNALPRWYLNGWSLLENTERLVGHPVRMQADSAA